MAPPKEHERRRKFHRRSKYGCIRCKAKHVKCNEQKPMCTNCLQTGNQCIYPITGQPLRSSRPSSVTIDSSKCQKVLNESLRTDPRVNVDKYGSESFDTLPEPSRRLLCHFSRSTIRGLRSIADQQGHSTIQRFHGNLGYMHICVMLSACAWAWSTGSMDEVRLPFLYHKTASYQFARQQILIPEATGRQNVVLAISALALVEAATGEFEASYRHLKAMETVVEEWSKAIDKVPMLPRMMLKMTKDHIRTSEPDELLEASQPAFMALLLVSIWDLTASPPRCGWWQEDLETPVAKTWQQYTKKLELNCQISKGLEACKHEPRLLNGDAVSSRIGFLATFLYLCSVSDNILCDMTLTAWLLQQIAGDHGIDKGLLEANECTQSFWLFYVLFSASIVSTSRTNTEVEKTQLTIWREVCNHRIRFAVDQLGVESWKHARIMLVRVMGGIGGDVEKSLEELWSKGIYQP
ncbi:uncharacterized protein FMAN_15522 [Fusarium mangiferae]|uniref:Zn(2)-C6 fungal-type domain-containing protein n=1 Tax=Fusarium mangiferae TaxID=192010 RepID=A0A1L7UFD6_FUSMA|nr:uncharacterized protein FMAN_15522 [Fusarium mangiferae]CVL09368.1 uncharacterized protein FMAN_15522 [Fusarium mangiferae]